MTRRPGERRKLEQTVKGGPGNLSREISVIEINK